MIQREAKIICDRCGVVMAQSYGKTWEIYRLKKKCMRIMHDIPAWNRTDEYHFCDKCTDDFKRWMKKDVATDAS